MAAESEKACGQVYNLGDERVVGLKELADMMVDVNGGGSYDVCSFPEERKRIDIGDYYADIGKIKAELGWSPKSELAEGLALTLAYYREHLGCYL